MPHGVDAAWNFGGCRYGYKAPKQPRGHIAGVLIVPDGDASIIRPIDRTGNAVVVRGRCLIANDGLRDIASAVIGHEHGYDLWHGIGPPLVPGSVPVAMVFVGKTKITLGLLSGVLPYSLVMDAMGEVTPGSVVVWESIKPVKGKSCR